ncbi:MAG: diaminohydroxyphosphoribosylaminopyrimidine deaminase [Saprospiraceae bacterium]|jgi:diaminohydroxyphosphoribosylaminopyrimidine deaminase/5-amino-6-(5-phosphoribosylamino)uracil reductase
MPRLAIDLNKLSTAQRDAHFMSEAFKMADKGRYTTQPNPNVGCVIVKNNQIISHGITSAVGGLHAEANAIQNAKTNLSDSTVYVTLEPCCHHGRTKPCSDALIAIKPKRVVVASRDPNPLVAGGGVKALQLAGIETTVGVGALQSEITYRAFFHRMRTARPFVTLKVAMSLDGKTAMANGESKWITSESARKEVHKLRLTACAVVTGVDTIIADDPQMTARLTYAERQPKRVVLDSQTRLPANAKILRQEGETWAFQETPNEQLESENVKLFASKLNDGRIELPGLLETLAENEINHVLVEAGATLSGAFMQAGLVDEIIVFMAPDVMGSDARDVFSTLGLNQMGDRICFEIKDARLIGRDIKLTLSRVQQFPLDLETE